MENTHQTSTENQQQTATNPQENLQNSTEQVNQTTSPENMAPTIQPVKKKMNWWWVLLAIVVIAVVGFLIMRFVVEKEEEVGEMEVTEIEVVEIASVDESEETYDSFEEAMQTSNDNFEQEKQDLITSELLINDSNLQLFLEPNYPADVFFVETENFISEKGYVAFEVSYNHGTGGDTPIFLVQETTDGYEMILDNQQILAGIESVDCEYLKQVGVPQNVYDFFLELNSKAYGVGSIIGCQL